MRIYCSRHHAETGGRTYFVIADGWIEVGKEASLTSVNAGKYLSPDGPGAAATMLVTYNGAPAQEESPFKGRLLQQWATLSFDGKIATVTVNSVWNGQFQPIPPGMHAILTPDYSHAAIATTGYASATPGMIGNDVWFPIGLNGLLVNSSRYVHVGHLSDGCVTVQQLGRWTAVYQYLISHRAPGSAGKRVGTLTVHKDPHVGASSVAGTLALCAERFSPGDPHGVNGAGLRRFPRPDASQAFARSLCGLPPATGLPRQAAARNLPRR